MKKNKYHYRVTAYNKNYDEISIGAALDEMIRHEMVWYRKLWRWLFPPKNTLSVEDIREAVRKLKMANLRERKEKLLNEKENL